MEYKYNELIEALKKIEQMSDCGSYEASIIRMKSIATDALKSLTQPLKEDSGKEKYYSLRQKIANVLYRGESVLDNIMEVIDKHPTLIEEGKDAIEFGEWITKNNYKIDSAYLSKWFIKDSLATFRFTTEELYNDFKNNQHGK